MAGEVIYSNEPVKVFENNRGSDARPDVLPENDLARFFLARRAPFGIFFSVRDLDIRCALRQYLRLAFGNDPATLILEELGVCKGSVRIDMAVINGELKAFEIKSDQDTLERLSTQSSAYNRVFDTVSIVVSAKHLKKVDALVPNWWGIVIAEPSGNEFPRLSVARPEALNPQQDALAIAQLLWRDEALSLLKAINVEKGLNSKPRHYLWDALAKGFTLHELGDMVRQKLKARENWKVGLPGTVSGGTCQPFAT
jgi:hypothetical protein